MPRLPSSEIDDPRSELTRVTSERDALLHLLLRTNSTALGGLARGWSGFTRRHRWADRWISRPSRWLWLVLTLRWPAGLRVNPLFDEAWYREVYPDAPRGRRAAYRQYLRLSVSKGRDPNPHFDTDWYLDRNPDVRDGHWHPLDHYLYFGWREARDPSADFDGFDYLRHHPDAVVRAVNPLLHRMRARAPAAGDLVDPFDPGGLRLPGPPPTIQRTLTHYGRYGFRRTVARAASEFGLVRRSFVQGGAGTAFTVAERDPRRITAHLDTPRLGAQEATSTLLVTGWAFSERAAATVSASVYLDGVLMTEATGGHHRPDVGAMYARASGSSHSGFSARVAIGDVEPGEHVLHVVIRDARDAVRIISRSFRRVEPETMYHHYFERSLPTDEEVALVRAAVTAEGPPSLHLGVIAGDEADTAASVRSIERQDYPDVTSVVLAQDDDPRPTDPVDQQRLVGFLRAGEQLAPAALWRLAHAARDDAVQVVYSDRDGVDEVGRHVEPWFLPDWAPDHLLAQDYVGGAFVARDTESFRRALDGVVGGAGDWRYALLLRLTAQKPRVAHVPEVLWSHPAWRIADDDTAKHELTTVRSELDSRGIDAEVMTTHVCPIGVIRQVTWPLREQPLVSVIIPTTGRLEFVEQTIEALARTAYERTEVIFLDNSRGRHPEGIGSLRGQAVTVIEQDEPFNWARLNNVGARHAHGELLLFINDDVECTNPDWLSAMVRQALRPGVGAVGALMHYPDGSIQHAGVFLVGHGGGAVHLFRGMDPGSHLYLDWHRVAREVTSVTGACMLVPRGVFADLGGFDEELAIAGNDVDFCLRVARTGRRVLMEPAATLIHHESRSRAGVDHFPDEGRMWERWAGVFKAGDPYYNPNLSEERVDATPAWQQVADHPPPVERLDAAAGVNLVGYIRGEMGLGQAIRGEAAALLAADIPFVVIDHQGDTPARMGDSAWAHKIVEEPVFDTNILHINADLLPRALEQLPPGLTNGRRTIGVWTWELSEFPEEWRGSFSLVDEVWVPSTFVRDAIAAGAPVPVHVVPHAVPRPRGPFLGRAHFGLPTGPFQFLAMYDTQSVMERKNPHGVVEAFTRAFPPGDDSVSLVLKVNSAGDREVTGLRALTSEHPSIHLVTDTLSRHAVDSLIATSDAFVSLHRSEGFGLPIAEAMASGKPVIATGWSGNMDFMDDENAACVMYELVTLVQSHGPYREGQRWAEPDLDDAAAWMQRLVRDGDMAAMLGEAAREAIRERCAPHAVGRAIGSRLVRTR